MKKLFLLSVAVALMLASPGCNQARSQQATIQEKLLLHPNPTNYEFMASVSDVKSAVQRAYDDWHYATSRTYEQKVWQGKGDSVTKRVYSHALQLIGHEDLLWKGDADALAKGLLTKPGNENDAYLYGGDAPYGESQVYFKGAMQLIYYADFHIHLTPLGPNLTRVEILALGSKVAAGVDATFSPVRGPGLVLVAVEPTTIEEYQVLLGVGSKLQTNDMPPLLTPGPDAQVRTLSIP